jgi:hypothetical protein
MTNIAVPTVFFNSSKGLNPRQTNPNLEVPLMLEREEGETSNVLNRRHCAPFQSQKGLENLFRLYS